MILYFLYLLTSCIAIQNRIQKLENHNIEQILDEFNYYLIYCENNIDIEKLNDKIIILEKIGQIYNERDLGIGKIICNKSNFLTDRIKNLEMNSLLFYRYGTIEVYKGEWKVKNIKQWIKNNKRPLIYIFEDTDELKKLISKKPSLVYFTQENQFIDPFILEKMENISKKYTQIFMVLAKSPYIRTDLNIDNNEILVLYSYNEKKIQFEGFLENLEYFMMEKLLPIVYQGTDLEIEYVMQNDLSFFVLFEQENEDYEFIKETAENHQYFVKFFVLQVDQKKLQKYFETLFKQKLDLDAVYFYNTKSKEILKTKRSEIKYLIWDYIDKNDGVKYDI